MKLSPLPFEVLGQVAPILSWVEGAHGSRLPESWNADAVPFAERERAWFLAELPAYSYDNVDDIVDGTRTRHGLAKPVALPTSVGGVRPSLSPPPGYDLLEAFGMLSRHFLVWNGAELCVRAGRMEELHELAIRMPVGHVVRHGHARALAQGLITQEGALELPELVTLLPTDSFGLRSVVRRGLSESHLHLTGVTSAEESWADNLLRTVSVPAGDPAEKRLLILNLFCGRLLALAVWASLEDDLGGLSLRPRRLLGLLDRVYFARSVHEMTVACQSFKREVDRATIGAGALDTASRAPSEGYAGRRDGTHHTRDGLLGRPCPKEHQFLLRWLAPSAFYRFGEGSKRSGTEDTKSRYRFVHQLHLAAHRRLVDLTPWSRRDARATNAGLESAQARDPKPAWRTHDGGGRIPPAQRDFLHQALFRYLVCRTHHWQRANQQGQTTGLRYFKEFYGSRQRRISSVSEIQQAELVFDRLRQWRGLRVLEGRVAPPRHAEDLAPWILAYARQKNRRIKKLGLVVHFKKEHEEVEDKSFSKRILGPALRIRWGRRRRMVREEGMGLYRMLRQPNPVTPFIVGIDACNLELATPPEVFAPVFRFLRELPIKLGADHRRYAPYSELDAAIRRLVARRRLGMTYHVGEDFRHLLSGLRAIDEVMRFLAPRPGDRLGHGTALALSPRDWLDHSGYQAVMPRLEWLDTLVWVHHFLGPGDDVVGELGIEDTIQRLSWQIYSESLAQVYDPLGLGPSGVGDARGAGRSRRPHREERLRGILDWDWSPLTLWDAWTLRQLDPYSVSIPELLRGKLALRAKRPRYTEATRRWHQIQERVRAELCPSIGSRNAFLLLALYWMDPTVRRQGDAIEVVDMQPNRKAWREVCTRVEDRLRTRVHEHELVVEVNPSSNRIIGPMARYRQHHVFRLTLDKDFRLQREVRVSVNTDNPAVCNTTLAHEYYLLGELLMADGVPEAEVAEWLEWLRQNGEDYNFVRRFEAPEDSPDMGHIVDWLSKVRPSVREGRTRAAKHKAFWDWSRNTRLRGHGFNTDAVAQSRRNLERVLALERELEQLRSQ